MKTTKSFAGNLCLSLFILIATCACSNTPKTTKEAESTTETTKEEGTIFFDITLNEALEKARLENKYVLINFHSTYCAPCKKMKKEVFPTPECGEYINKKFIPIMVDGEDEGYGTELAKQHKIFIYPSYLILSPNRSLVGEIIGAELDVNKFLDMLKTTVLQFEK